MWSKVSSLRKQHHCQGQTSYPNILFLLYNELDSYAGKNGCNLSFVMPQNLNQVKLLPCGLPVAQVCLYTLLHVRCSYITMFFFLTFNLFPEVRILSSGEGRTLMLVALSLKSLPMTFLSIVSFCQR